jgi:hypothetical protein
MIFTTILVRYTSLFLFEATLLATIGYNFRMSFDNGQESSCRYTETVTRYLDPVFAHSNAVAMVMILSLDGITAAELV